MMRLVPQSFPAHLVDRASSDDDDVAGNQRSCSRVDHAFVLLKSTSIAAIVMIWRHTLADSLVTSQSITSKVRSVAALTCHLVAAGGGRLVSALRQRLPGKQTIIAPPAIRGGGSQRKSGVPGRALLVDALAGQQPGDAERDTWCRHMLLIVMMLWSVLVIIATYSCR